MDLAAFSPYHPDFVPIFPSTASHLVSKRLIFLLYIRFFLHVQNSGFWSMFSSPSLFIFLFQSKKDVTSSSVDVKPNEDDKVYCKD